MAEPAPVLEAAPWTGEAAIDGRGEALEEKRASSIKSSHDAVVDDTEEEAVEPMEAADSAGERVVGDGAAVDAASAATAESGDVTTEPRPTRAEGLKAIEADERRDRGGVVVVVTEADSFGGGVLGERGRAAAARGWSGS